MKNIIIILFILISIPCLSAPVTTMSIVPIAVDSRVIKATDENARNNVITTIFNAHDHSSFISDTVTIGSGNAGNPDITSSVTIVIDVSGTVSPMIRFNTLTNVFELSNDGNNFFTISTE